MPPRHARTVRSSSRSSKRSEEVAVGRVVGAHALRGLLRVRAYQPPASSLAAGRHVILEGPGGRREVRLRSASPHGRGLVLVGLEGIEDRTAAEALVGATVLVPQGDLPPPAENEFYYHEIEGFRVETVGGEHLGVIVETFPTGTSDVWVVRGEGREHLIPVIADVVRAIDRSGQRVVIEPLPGLLE